MRFIGKQPSESWGTFRVLHSLAFTTHKVLLRLWALLTLIELVMLMIKSLLLDLSFVLVPVWFLGLIRRKILLHYHHLRLNIKEQSWLVRRFFGFDGWSLIFSFMLIIPLLFDVIIIVPYIFLTTQWSINALSIKIHIHFIWQLIQDGDLSLQYLPKKRHVVDIFTKPLASPSYILLWSMLRVNELVLEGSWGVLLPFYFFFPAFFIFLSFGEEFSPTRFFSFSPFVRNLIAL